MSPNPKKNMAHTMQKHTVLVLHSMRFGQCLQADTMHHGLGLLRKIATTKRKQPSSQPGSHPAPPASRQESLRSSQAPSRRPRIFRMLRTGARNFSKFSGRSARERDFERRVSEISRMLRTGARFSSKFSGCSARERDFERNNDEFLRMLRRGARFQPKFSGCSAQECHVHQNFQDAPHGSAILTQIFRMLRTGTRF